MDALRASLLVVAVVGALSVPVAGCGPSEGASDGPERGDGLAGTLVVGATISVGDGGSGITGVAVGGGGVWAGSGTGPCSGSVSHIDPDENAVAATVRTGPVDDVAAGSGAVWAVGYACRRGERPIASEAALFRIDPRRQELVATIALPRAGDARATGVAAGADGVWVAQSYGPSRGEVVRIDPATNAVVARVRIEGHPGDLAVGGDAVWVLSDPAYTDEHRGGGSLLRIDAATDEVAAALVRGQLGSIGAQLLPPMIAAAEDAVWVGSSVEPLTGPTVPEPVAIRVDTSSDEVVSERVAVERFHPFAAADDGIWFVGPRAAVSRLDPDTLEVEQSSRQLGSPRATPTTIPRPAPLGSQTPPPTP